MRNVLAEEEADAVDDEVADHVAGKVATPDVEQGEDDSAGEDGNEVNGPPAGEMGVGEDGHGKNNREGGASAELANFLDEVPAVEDFFDHGGARDEHDAVPEGVFEDAGAHDAAVSRVEVEDRDDHCVVNEHGGDEGDAGEDAVEEGFAGRAAEADGGEGQVLDEAEPKEEDDGEGPPDGFVGEECTG